MSEEMMAPGMEDLSLDDLSEFGISDDMSTITIEENEVVLSEDLAGFASGFPDWDLLPPKKKKK